MSKISVAMTTYNGAPFLQEQLQSLLSQTRLPDEVVICDDGSGDETLRILHSFIQDNHLQNWHILTNPVNLGYVRNFRRALAATTGDIIFLCDQDDIWHEDKIARMSKILENNPQITALACGYRLIDGSTNLIDAPVRKIYTPRGPRGTLSRVKRGRVLYGNMAQGCACAYRRPLADQYCRIENCNILPHDWALNMLAYQENSLYFLDEELLFYRLHGKNAIGISKPDPTRRTRIPRLQEYTACIADAVHLPLPPEALAEVKRVTAVSNIRIRWLQKKQLWVWVGGLLRYLPTVVRYFFLQYMNDLVLVLRGKIPS